MIHLPPQPSETSDPQPSIPLSRETLLKALAESLAQLGETCLPFPNVDRKRLLWFEPGECDTVDAMLKNGELSKVISQWEGERTLSTGGGADVSCQRPVLSASPPTESVVLEVTDLSFNDAREGDQAPRFRHRTFAVSDAYKDVLVEKLSDVGLLDKINREVDGATHTTLPGAPISGVVCRAEWHSSHRSAQGETQFIIALTVAPPQQEKETISLTFDSSGYLYGLRFAASRIESDYRGHGHMTFKLEDAELRALLELVDAVGGASTQSGTPFQRWEWLHHTPPRIG